MVSFSFQPRSPLSGQVWTTMYRRPHFVIAGSARATKVSAYVFAWTKNLLIAGHVWAGNDEFRHKHSRVIVKQSASKPRFADVEKGPDD